MKKDRGERTNGLLNSVGGKIEEGMKESDTRQICLVCRVD